MKIGPKKKKKKKKKKKLSMFTGQFNVYCIFEAFFVEWDYSL